MKNYTLHLCVLAALSLGSLKGGPVLPLTQVPSIQEFEDFIKTSSLWRELGGPKTLIRKEKEDIKSAICWKKYTLPIKVNRSISKFKGSILLIGGGKKYGKTFINKGVTCIEGKLKLIRAYKNAKLPFEIEDGFKLETEEDRQTAIASLQSQINKVLETYYTLNIDPSVQPDLVASATDLKGLTRYFKGHQFDEIIYEGLPTFVFLDPRTWEVAERLCKPGGRIRIIPGLGGSRPILLLLKGTKWERQVYSHLKATYNPAYYEYLERADRFWASLPEGTESLPPELEYLEPKRPAEAEYVHVTLELINYSNTTPTGQ